MASKMMLLRNYGVKKKSHFLFWTPTKNEIYFLSPFSRFYGEIFTWLKCDWRKKSAPNYGARKEFWATFFRDASGWDILSKRIFPIFRGIFTRWECNLCRKLTRNNGAKKKFLSQPYIRFFGFFRCWENAWDGSKFLSKNFSGLLILYD